MAAEHLDYTVNAGEVLAIVGESGSGKSQSSMSLLGLLPSNGRATGSAKLNGRELIGMPPEKMQAVRGNDISVIFQEPMTALNPVYTAGYQIVETLRVHLDIGPREAKERASSSCGSSRSRIPKTGSIRSRTSSPVVSVSAS